MTKKIVEKLANEFVEEMIENLRNNVSWTLCPDCGATLVSGNNMSGVKCPKCTYWFCY